MAGILRSMFAKRECSKGCQLCDVQSDNNDDHKPACCKGSHCGPIQRAALEATSGKGERGS